MNLFEQTSILNKSIRLTERQWIHLEQRHPEMSGQKAKIMQTISDPDFVVQSTADESVQYCRRFEATPVTNKLLLVVVKHLNGDGFVITAFFANRVRKEGKRILYGKENFDQLRR